MVTNEPGALTQPRFPINNGARASESGGTERSITSTTPAPRRSWLTELLPRFRAHWLIKTIAIPAFVTGFFITYFQLLRNPMFPVRVMPATVADQLIGFHPAAIVPYLALWLYVFLAPALLRGRRELVIYTSEALALTVVAFGTFLLWPTAVPLFHFDEANHPLFALLKNVDAAGNACPSLHVAFAVFTAIWLARLLRKAAAPVWIHLLNAGSSAAIVYSTLATKQHVAIDALAGIALGAAAALYDPPETATSFNRGASPLNRQSLALLVSFTSKLTLFALRLDQTNPTMAVVLFVAPDLWILAGLLVPNVSSLIPTATWFETRQREVWLTIDDGPHPTTTLPMLDLLERHGAKATFFPIGARAAANPSLVNEIVRRGHTIGNHTQNHPLATFWLAGSRRTAREIDACQSGLRAHGVPATGWFRPPAGIKTFSLRRLLAERRMILVGWSTRAREHGSTSIDRPLRRLKNNLHPGAILLIHESDRHGAQRVALLSALLDHLAATGFTCVLPQREALRTGSFTMTTHASRRSSNPSDTDGHRIGSRAPSPFAPGFDDDVRQIPAARIE